MGRLQKPVRCAVAAVVRPRLLRERFLAVRRPLDDDLLPGLWGLPAVRLAPGELPEDAVRRIGREKLATSIEPTRFVGIDAADRGDYLLILMDIEADLTGDEPRVAASTTSATAYVDQRWTDDPYLLSEGAARGSVCSRILLAAMGAGDEAKP